MTREDLRGIIAEITDEQLKAILDINTADIGKAKKDVESLNEKVESLSTDNETLKEKITELTKAAESGADYKQQLEELQKTIKEKDEADKLAKEDALLTSAIEECFGEKKFTSDYVREGIIADMKKEIAKPENKGKGYSELFETLTKDKAGIFANPNPPADVTGLGNFETNASENAMRAVMGLGPIKE